MNVSDSNLARPDRVPDGVRLVADDNLPALETAAHDAGLSVHRIDLQGCDGKHELLRRIAAALAFPSGFGHNWDALSDSLRDLGWLPGRGYVLAFAHGGDLRTASPNDFATFVEVLAEAATDWAARDVRFRAVIALPHDASSI